MYECVYVSVCARVHTQVITSLSCSACAHYVMGMSEQFCADTVRLAEMQRVILKNIWALELLQMLNTHIVSRWNTKIPVKYIITAHTLYSMHKSTCLQIRDPLLICYNVNHRSQSPLHFCVESKVDLLLRLQQV